MIIAAISTATVGYTILLHINLYEWFPVLVVIPVGIVALIIHFVIRRADHDRKVRMAKTSPHYDDPTTDHEDKIKKKMQEDEYRRQEFEGEDTAVNLYEPSAVLHERALKLMKKRRTNPF